MPKINLLMTIMENGGEMYTFEQCKEDMIGLWDWLRKNPTKGKEDWPGWNKENENAMDCPCCIYAVKKKKEQKFIAEACPFCPLPRIGCIDSGSFFDQWDFLENPIGQAYTEREKRNRTVYATDLFKLSLTLKPKE